MKSYVLGLWNVFDRFYYTFSRLRYVTDQEHRNTLFRVRLTKYKGRNVILHDGTEITKGDVLLKIHLHNVRMIQDLHSTTSEVKRAVLIYHMIKRALPRLASYITTNHENAGIKGIIGITSLYRGADRLGFEVIPITNGYYRLYKLGSFLPMYLLANTSIPNTPAYLFMSRDQLIKKYHLQQA